MPTSSGLKVGCSNYNVFQYKIMQAKVEIGTVVEQSLLFHIYLEAEKASAEFRRHRLVKLFTKKRLLLDGINLQYLICHLSFVMNFPYLAA